MNTSAALTEQEIEELKQHLKKFKASQNANFYRALGAKSITAQYLIEKSSATLTFAINYITHRKMTAKEFIALRT